MRKWARHVGVGVETHFAEGQATATGQFPGGTVVADAPLRGLAFGLTSARLDREYPQVRAGHADEQAVSCWPV